MAPPVLTLRDVDFSIGGTSLLLRAEMSLSAGERLCVVGRNGAGKSSLLKIAGGVIEADQGERFVQPGVRIGMLAQAPDFAPQMTVLDYVLDDDGADAAHIAAPFLDALQLEENAVMGTLSGGQARRAALARVLSAQPDILLLDEPTNHLDLPAIEWLEQTLSGLSCAMMLISHDRRFLEEVGTGVLWIDRAKIRRLDQGFAAFEAWRDEIYIQEEQAAHKLARQIVREEDWLRYGVTARRKRNQRRLAELEALRERKRTMQGPTGQVSLEANEARASSRKVMEARGVFKAYDDLVVVQDLSLRVMKGDKLGIVGPNGAGKTTLIKLLTGVMAPDKGNVELAPNLVIASLDQARSGLRADWSLKDALTKGGSEMVTIGNKSQHVVSYMKDFLFKPEQAGTPLNVLSGGELARVMLARALSLPSNMMVLDEPTNDLDLETLDLLEDFLSTYPGTVLLVSHDRDFLNRVVDAVLVFEGDGRWGLFSGGYDQARQALQAKKRGMGRTENESVDKEGRSQVSSGLKPDGKRVRTGRTDKLSYKEKYALETLPDEMEKLEVKIRELEGKLEEPDFYQKDPAAFEATSTALAAAMASLSKKEEEWLSLEMKREAIEGSA